MHARWRALAGEVTTLGLIGLLVFPAAGARGAPAAQAALPSVGVTVVADGWEITLDSYTPALRGSSATATAAFTVTDLQDRSSACTEDIAIETGDGLRYPPVSLDQTPGPPRIARGPGAPTPEPSTQRRYCISDAIFELDPTATNLTLYILGIAFQLP